MLVLPVAMHVAEIVESLKCKSSPMIELTYFRSWIRSLELGWAVILFSDKMYFPARNQSFQKLLFVYFILGLFAFVLRACYIHILGHQYALHKHLDRRSVQRVLAFLFPNGHAQISVALY